MISRQLALDENRDEQGGSVQRETRSIHAGTEELLMPLVTQLLPSELGERWRGRGRGRHLCNEHDSVVNNRNINRKNGLFVTVAQLHFSTAVINPTLQTL